MAEDWVKDARSKAKVEFNARSEVEKELGALKENLAEIPKHLDRSMS